MHTHHVKRIAFIGSGRSRGATARFDIASCGAVFRFPIDCPHIHHIMCDVSHHLSSAPFLLFELWIGQKVVCARICDADVHAVIIPGVSIIIHLLIQNEAPLQELLWSSRVIFLDLEHVCLGFFVFMVNWDLQ
jgi:hypothetical protein